jgi:hypothetical protein
MGTVVGFRLVDEITKLLLPCKVRCRFATKKDIPLPLVKFDHLENAVLIPWVIMPQANLSVDGFVDCSLQVMPLAPAYAFTVHKVQGVTLDRPVVLDCSSMWKCPHLIYVAASRVRKLKHLRILNLDPVHVVVNPTALGFSKSLQKSTTVAKALLEGKPSNPAAVIC